MVIALLVLILLAILFPGLLRAVFGVIALVLLFAFVKVAAANAEENWDRFCWLSVNGVVWNNGPCELQRAIVDRPITDAAAFISSHGEEVQIIAYVNDDVGIRIEKGSSGQMVLSSIGHLNKSTNCYIGIHSTFCFYKTASELHKAELTSAASASETLGIPNFPVDRGCEAYAKSMTGFSYAHNLCLSKEQDSYDAIKDVWSYVPRDIQEKCYDQAGYNLANMQYMSPLGFPYLTLATCLGNEAERLRLRRGFQK